MEEGMNPYPIGPIQIFSIIFSIFLLVLIVYLIRKKKVREEYAIRGLIDKFSSLLGIQYQPAALFLILFACLFLLVFHFSIVISDMKKKINALAMTVSILEERGTKKE